MLIVFEQFVQRINDYPGAMNNLLISGTPFLRYPVEIVIVNDTDKKLFSAHNTNYIPHRLVYRWNETNKNDGRPEWEVLEQRTNAKHGLKSIKTPTLCKVIHECQGVKSN